MAIQVHFDAEAVIEASPSLVEILKYNKGLHNTNKVSVKQSDGADRSLENTEAMISITFYNSTRFEPDAVAPQFITFSASEDEFLELAKSIELALKKKTKPT